MYRFSCGGNLNWLQGKPDRKYFYYSTFSTQKANWIKEYLYMLVFSHFKYQIYYCHTVRITSYCDITWWHVFKIERNMFKIKEIVINKKFNVLHIEYGIHYFHFWDWIFLYFPRCENIKTLSHLWNKFHIQSHINIENPLFMQLNILLDNTPPCIRFHCYKCMLHSSA